MVEPDEGPGPGAVVAMTVVVAGGADAGSAATIDAVHAQEPPPDLDLSVADPSSSTEARAVGRALRGSRGSYVAVVEAGTVPGPTWLARSVAVLRDDPTLGLVAIGDDPEGLRIDPDARAFVCRRTMWDAIGGLDGGVSAPARGLDLGWRCWLTGWRAASVAVPGTTAPARGVPSRRDLEHLCALLLHDPGDLTRRGWRRRRTLQRARRRPEGELGALLAEAIERGAAPGLADVLASAGAGGVLGPRRRIVVATADTLAGTMAGPGIRAWRLADALSREHDVHLVTTGRCDLEHPCVPVEGVDHDRFVEVVDGADIVIFQGWIMADRPWLAQSDKAIIADIYAPMQLEQLEQGRDAAPEGGRWNAVTGATETMNQQLRRADYLLCASRKQRDFYLGQLSAVGRVNQVLYDEDTSFTERMRIVPFGIDDHRPVSSRGALRGVVDGIGPDDDVVLWGGGIYNWFDPVTLIRAVDRLRHRRPRLRLYFLGTRHPNPEIPEMRMAVAARRLAAELGLTGSHVFFNDGWVAFDERADYLLDADVAVSIHEQHVETEYSFRTRILDYLWCSLPIVATSGDSFAPLVRDHGLGLVVEPHDVDGLEAALETLLSDDARRKEIAANCEAFAEQFRWASVLEPVMDICRRPRRAPDVACPDTAISYGVTGRPPAWREDLTLARRYLAEGGVSLVVKRLRSRAARLRAEAE